MVIPGCRFHINIVLGKDGLGMVNSGIATSFTKIFSAGMQMREIGTLCQEGSRRQGNLRTISDGSNGTSSGAAQSLARFVQLGQQLRRRVKWGVNVPLASQLQVHKPLGVSSDSNLLRQGQMARGRFFHINFT
jgi:hypothetical protein